MKRRLVVLAFSAVAAVSAFAHLATDPVPREPDKPWWRPRFEAKKALAAKGGYPVVFIGDSITHNWEHEGKGKAVWTKHFESGEYRALNVGFSADRTEHVLWRLRNGQLDGVDPKAIVLMIGTNNTGHRSADVETPLDTFLGIRAIIEDLDVRFPKAYKIICPIFPRGERKDSAMRVRNDRVNQALYQYVGVERQRGMKDRQILWCDVASALTDADGTLSREIAPDLLHPGEKGHELWAEKLMPCLDYAFGKKKRFPYATLPAPGKTTVVVTTPKSCCPEPKAVWLSAMRRRVKGNSKRFNERLLEKREIIGKKANRHFDLVMVGDSITDRWESRFGTGASYVQLTNRFDTLNVGFGGDHTETVIWNALYGGMSDGYVCDAITLMIGTNNRKETAEEVAAGVKACVETLRAKQPKAKIALMSITPWRNSEDTDPLNAKNRKTNEMLRALADGENVVFVNIYDKFLKPDGTTNVDLLVDRVHPSEAGYRIWLDALLPVLEKMIVRP